ncbi:thioesterase superfamily protein [Haloterrigena turkmenica DSM 5511]|uniref:Thioesterase superfamily protein n=1 Tax=Haloterrigena turkmenica (strain ATCC 51198 / DSM 5511 / JCM 9101 / NCIMB 13204 / VKM B-1734 / 4k) TaxID=543526 RepID=D2RQM0_HALTV|nr:thioesterase family protein [Haloterrigena turkmenica]ADB60351.1 thioesterase superfamily protein [Haloterrigena turkmenica DSM 5511]
MSAPFTVSVPVRYRDLDPLDHVNHAVFATYLEIARTDYLESVVDIAAEEISFVIANLEIDYERPIVKGDEPEVSLRVSRLGDSSCTMTYEIRVGDDVAATAETTMVYIDPETKRPAPFPDEIREPIAAYEGLETMA